MLQETEENQTRSLPPPQPRAWCFNFVVFAGYCAAEGFPGGASGKEPVCQCRRCKRCRFDPWVRKISWRACQPTPVFLPGEPPWTEEPDGLQSMRSQRVGYNWSDLVRTHTQKRLIYRSLITPTMVHVGILEGPWPWLDPQNGFQWSPTAAATKSLQSCPTLCDPMDWSLPGSSVHRIFQARVLEWGAIAFTGPTTAFPLSKNSSIPLREGALCESAKSDWEGTWRALRPSLAGPPARPTRPPLVIHGVITIMLLSSHIQSTYIKYGTPGE